ncbi:MAG: hypothetical protein VYE73_15475 [Acidobacteriota bacterium]|nr:hypothetical protein [Acidobacteriota bacterium]
MSVGQVEDQTPAPGAETDLVEWYFDQGWTDGLPVVPPTAEKVQAVLDALGVAAHEHICRVAPRHGDLSAEILAINLVMAGARPEYAPLLRTAIEALCDPAFNLNGVQATTHMAAPLMVVNGPVRHEIGMNAGHNVFGSGNRANATLGRAIRLILLNVGGAQPGELDKSTLGHPGKYTYCIAENEEESPLAPFHVSKGFAGDTSTVFVMAAEPPHSVTNHVADDAEGILASIASAMATYAHNNAVSSGHCAVVVGPEHASTIAGDGWDRGRVQSHLWENARVRFGDIAFDHRYGKVYNRNLPAWYGRELESRNPIVPSPDHVHVFVAGGSAGRFSAFIPGWGHMSTPVLRALDGSRSPTGDDCLDESCRVEDRS